MALVCAISIAFDSRNDKFSIAPKQIMKEAYSHAQNI